MIVADRYRRAIAATRSGGSGAVERSLLLRLVELVLELLLILMLAQDFLAPEIEILGSRGAPTAPLVPDDIRLLDHGGVRHYAAMLEMTFARVVPLSTF